MLSEVLAAIWFTKIAIYDVQHHLIKNFDLLVLGLILVPIKYMNWKIGFLGLFIYLFINLLSNFRIGYGDMKLSFICSLVVSTYNELLMAITVTWILAGLFALTRPRMHIAFAPFMIIGTYFTKIPLY